MKITKLLFVILLCAPQMLMAAKPKPKPKPKPKTTGGTVHAKKPWTVLVYMAADNNLYPFADLNQRQMEQVGSNSNTTILIHRNTHNPHQKKMSKKLLVQKNRSVQQGATESLDSGSAKTLINAYSWAHKEWPSDHFALIIWNHGSGALNRTIQPEPEVDRGVCFDDSTGHYLSDLNLRTALESICKLRGGKKLDIVAFDACLMAGIETDFTLKPYANFIVSSQENVPDAGFNYQAFLTHMAQGLTDPAAVAVDIVNTYDQQYAPQHGWRYTMSAVQLDLIDPVVQNNNQIAHLLTELIVQPNDLWDELSEILDQVTTFGMPDYIDLYHLYSLIEAHIPAMNLAEQDATQLRQLTGMGKDLISQMVIANKHDREVTEAHGVSIYFPTQQIQHSYPHLFWSQYSMWPALLNAYFN